MRLPQQPPQLSPSAIPPEGLRKLFEMSPQLSDGGYSHWDELRYREPPEGCTREQWWFGVRLARSRSMQPIEAMRACYGIPFGFVPVPAVQRALHEFDRANVGSAILSALGNPDAQMEYRVRQLIEEAISSSEIEGARPTTREVARQMLRDKRAPASGDERMILNNFRAMERLLELHAHKEALTLEHLLELHRILGENAREVAGAEGMFRTAEHQVTVEDGQGNVWHVPPPAAGLPERMARLLAFANGDDEAGQDAFIHPIIRAIVTHFWLGYEHPFRDGNGRIARALYYWCMLRHAYEVAEFLSISGPIDRSPKAYYLAFAHTETDAGDLTYFVLHQLGVMRTALDDLLQHLQSRAERLKNLAAVVATFDELNHRQRSLLEHAIRHPTQGQTIEGQATSHAVHYMTARSDLADLERRGLLVHRKIGKTKRYYPSQKLLAPTSTSKPRAGRSAPKRSRRG
jgi:Fic family protein